MSGRRLFWILGPLLVLLAAYWVDRARDRWHASRVVATVKAITVQASQRGLLTRRLLEHNVDLVRQTESKSPAEVALPMARGSLYLLLERPQAAIRAYKEARSIEPRGELFAHLGRAYFAAGDRDKAFTAFDKALLLDHNQRRHLRDYLRRRPNLGRVKRSEIFSESFESGDLEDVRMRAKTGSAAENG